MATAARISRAKLKTRVGRTMEVLVDACAGTGSPWPAPRPTRRRSTAGCFVPPAAPCAPATLVKVRIDRADAFDLHAPPTDLRLRCADRPAAPDAPRSSPDRDRTARRVRWPPQGSA